MGASTLKLPHSPSPFHHTCLAKPGQSGTDETLPTAHPSAPLRRRKQWEGPGLGGWWGVGAGVRVSFLFLWGKAPTPLAICGLCCRSLEPYGVLRGFHFLLEERPPVQGGPQPPLSQMVLISLSPCHLSPQYLPPRTDPSEGESGEGEGGESSCFSWSNSRGQSSPTVQV